MRPGTMGLLGGRVVSGREDRRGYIRDGVKTLLLRDAELGDPRQHPARWQNKGLDLEADQLRAWLSEEDTQSLDLSTVVPSMAGPARPQDRVNLSEVRQSFRDALPKLKATAQG